ncbi:MAG: CHAT domain-containing protein [Planctomycetota bacterium]
MRGFIGVAMILIAPAWAAAQGDSLAKFREAEKRYDAGHLLEAAQLFQPLSLDDKNPHREQSFDRLVSIYMRLGRCDQAIQTGERYLDLLKSIGDVRTTRLVEVQMAACWSALGHYGTAEKILENVMSTSLEEMPIAMQVTAWELRARCQAKRGDKLAARKSWAAIEGFVTARLRGVPGPVPAAEQIVWTRRWAESLRGQERFAQAELALKSLLPLHERTKDDVGRCDTWKELAILFREQNRLTEADAAIDDAMRMLAASSKPSLLAQADLEAERAEILQLRKKGKDAKAWRDRAIEHYQEAFKNPDHMTAQGGSPVLVFWKLQTLIQQSQQFRKALELTQTQAEQWAGGSLLRTKLETEQGSLHYLLGATKTGRQMLRDAVEGLERQRPWNLIELPRAYINLAAVEAATGDLDKAERLIQRTADLYAQYQLPDDSVIVEACNLRGSVLAQRGDYAKAIQHFREGIERCSVPTLETPMQRSNLLLNIALLHKSQGELPEAIKLCTEAVEEFEKFAEPDSLGFAAFDAGLANMHLAQNQLGKAYERTQRILHLCKIHGIDRGPLIGTAKHIQAIQSLSKRDLAAAAETWNDLLKMQEREEQTLLLPRTLNYLGLTAELRDDRAQAEELYRRALQHQENNQRSYPATQFITLWRLANVVKDKNKAEAQKLLDQAIRLVEKARLRMFGDAQQRATFFAQFGPAFEQSVDWMLANNDAEAAFQVLTRGRSRTLMDQLQTSNLDPLATLVGPEGEKLKKREESLRQKLASLRARAGLVGLEGLPPAEIKALLADFDQAQQDYAQTWREIWNASPEYHSLADPNLPEHVLSKLRERVLSPKTALLAYHIGKQSSHVLLLGDNAAGTQFYPLMVPEELAQNIAPAEPVEHATAGLRGVAIVPKGGVKPAAAAAPLPPPVLSPKLAPLTQATARSLIDRYRTEILDREFQATRGFLIKPRDPNRPLAPQRPDVVGQVFLPKALRDRLRELKLETLIVIPDGPLHTLPLEALVLEAGAKPRFVIDELPPLIYAPSGSILAVLAERPALSRRNQTLLTVCNPAYIEGKGDFVADTRDAGGLLGFAGQLPRLPFTAAESKLIGRYFDKDRITTIADADATERNVAQAVRGKAIVHIAAHGFADPRFGNLFGALALSPSTNAVNSSDDDGFLSLHEIYRLPLADCDLAVLSACLTHVGPQQPMEAGVTLANGFLSAGARRVVASHWNVADRSTSQLMSYFFEELTREGKDGGRLSTPQAMQEARKRLRDSSEANWSAPFYWAPFVVLGTPE